MKKRLLLLWFGVISLALSAQTDADSLYNMWGNTALPDTSRLRSIHALGVVLSKQNPDSARFLATQELEFAQKIDNKQWQGRALNTIGLTWRLQTDFAKAMQFYEQSIPLLEQAQDRGTLSEVYKNIGDVHRLQSNFPKAIDYISQSLALAEAAGDKRREADAYVCFSTIYYMASGNLDKTKAYLLKAKPLYESIHHEEGLSFVHSNLSLVYFEQEDYENALNSIAQCLKIQEKRGDLFGMATSFQNRATVFGRLGRYKEAIADFEREIEIFEKIGDQEGLSDAYSSVGELWIERKNYPKAIRACKEALRFAVVLGGYNMSEANACGCLYTAYSKQGNYPQAFKFLERFSLLKDSLHRNETAERLKQMEMNRQAVADSLAREKENFKIEMAHQQTLRRKDRVLGWLLAICLVGSLIAWAVWARMLYFRRRSLEMQTRSETLEKQQLLNEIDLLKTQVNPHFLFNSLSILSSLVHKSADLSEQFIEQLAQSYRYILEQKDQPLVPLRTELDFISSYAFLLKIRFEDKFDLHFDIAELDLDRCKIAPLTLQLLVENAVKHNRMSAKEPLIIQVFLKDKQTLVVKNPLQPRPIPKSSTGIGLQNIINRYGLLTDRPVWAGECEDTFVVKVPLL